MIPDFIIVFCILLLFFAFIRRLYLHTKLEDLNKKENLLRESERSKSLVLSNLPGLAYRCDYDREWTMHFVRKVALNLPDITLRIL